MENDHGDQAKYDLESSEHYSRAVQDHFNHENVSLEAEEEDATEDRKARQEDHQQCVS